MITIKRKLLIGLLLVAGASFALIWIMNQERHHSEGIALSSFQLILKEFVEHYKIKKVKVTEYQETTSRFRFLAEVKSKFKFFSKHSPRKVCYVLDLSENQIVICTLECGDHVFDVEVMRVPDLQEPCGWLVERFRNSHPEFPIAVREGVDLEACD